MLPADSVLKVLRNVGLVRHDNGVNLLWRDHLDGFGHQCVESFLIEPGIVDEKQLGEVPLCVRPEGFDRIEITAVCNILKRREKLIYQSLRCPCAV